MPPQAPFSPDQLELLLPKTDYEDGTKRVHRSHRLWRSLAQTVIVGLIGLYAFGQVAYFTSVYSVRIASVLEKWWGIHAEMARPTYFVLFAVVPIAMSVVVLECTRQYNLHRLSGEFAYRIALVLRRKPSLLGFVSYWSFGEWLFFGLLVGGNVFVFVTYFTIRVAMIKERTGQPLDFNTYLQSIALTMGFTCVYNMAFLFLPATRNCMWMEFFNVSYANGIKYHRWVGVATVLAAFLHGGGFFWVWIRKGIWREQALPCFDCSLATQQGSKTWMHVLGELALLMFIFIGLTSIPYVRRKFYNVFYYTHQLLFLGVIFSVMHWAPIIWWVLPTFLLYCFHRAVSASNSFTPVEVAELTAIADDLVKVVIKRSPGRDGHYRVGQFLYLNVPAISKLQWHAFTISSSPRTSPTTVTVLLKSLGDWTQELVTYANDCKQKSVLPTVYVDGYYGASLEMYDEYSTVCLVGGGIGATPMFAILEDLAAKLANHETIKQKVVFVFSFREIALLEEVHPVLMRLKELDPQEKYFKTHFYLTRVPADSLLNRRLDIERLQGKALQATAYDSAINPMPFFEPLRSRTYKALAMTTVFFFGVIIVVYLQYGNGKIKRSDATLWPLQQFVESSLLIVAGAFACFFIVAERLSKRKSKSCCASKELETNIFHSAAMPLATSDVTTYRDLLSHYNVKMGERPDTKNLMAKAYEFHNDTRVTTYGKPVIGVFVSGPNAMKSAVEQAAAQIGASHFDIHEEEFEL